MGMNHALVLALYGNKKGTDLGGAGITITPI